jgi:hypothetical protein
MRLAMDKKVRDEITRKGVGRSQIIILEALLKLRQVCCDLRLVSDAPPKKGSTSGKLDSLMEMLEAVCRRATHPAVFAIHLDAQGLIEARAEKTQGAYASSPGKPATGARRSRTSRAASCRSS